MRYTEVVATRTIPAVKRQLERMAQAAGKVLPEYLRGMYDKAIAEDDARLGND